MVRAIWPITSIGPTNIVVYKRNETNVPADSGGPPPNRRGTASTHTPSVVACTASISSGQNVVHMPCRRLISSVTSSLWPPNRATSRASWLNALTTRIPGIVSDRTSVSRDHLRHTRRNARLSASPCR